MINQIVQYLIALWVILGGLFITGFGIALAWQLWKEPIL